MSNLFLRPKDFIDIAIRLLTLRHFWRVCEPHKEILISSKHGMGLRDVKFLFEDQQPLDLVKHI